MYKGRIVVENQYFQTCAEGELNGIQVFLGSGSVLELNRIGVEAIVNCANEKLGNQGGLAGDIAAIGGAKLTAECDEFIKTNGILRKKQVISTNPGNLPYKRILHVAGPVVTSLRKDQMEELQTCVYNSIVRAKEDGLSSVGIPGISCGTFGFPKREAAICHLAGFIQYANDHSIERTVKKVYFTLFSSVELAPFVERFEELMEEGRFDYAKLLGEPDKRLNCFTKTCGGCKRNYPMDWFSLSTCHKDPPNPMDWLSLSYSHKVYCNYCVYRYEITYCYTCKSEFTQPFDYALNDTHQLFIDLTKHYCRNCDKLVPKDPKNCKRCKNICAAHFNSPTDRCPYCQNTNS